MTAPAQGTLIGIARRAAPRAPMEELREGTITIDTGLAGDYRSARSVNRRITVLAREAWEEALSELKIASGKVRLPWTARRANLFVEGVALPKIRGGLLRVGPVLLEVTYPTEPCQRMDEAYSGLMAALQPDWRGGICCRVIEGGAIAIGDAVMHPSSPTPVQT